MNHLFAAFVLWIAAATQAGGSSSPLQLTPAAEARRAAVTFDEAVTLAAGKQSRSPFEPLRSEIAALRRATLPSVRLDLSGNVSRTLDIFGDDPLDLRSTSSVIAFDYPLWDRGLTRARIESAEAKLRRVSEKNRLDDVRFSQVVEVFGQLYLAQRQSELFAPLYEELSNEVSRSAALVSSGEISNLNVSEWQELALSFESQLLEVEARGLDASARLQVLTGVSEVRAVIDLENVPPATTGAAVSDDQVEVMRLAVEDSELRLREVIAAGGFRASLSGFAGLSAAESVFRDVNADGAFGVYALRVHLSYPLLGGAGAIGVAEARGALEQTRHWQDAALNAAQARASDYRLRIETSKRRIALYRRSVEAAREREESLKRLVRGGLRSQNEVLRATAERTRRESELLAVEVERWKAAQLLARMHRPTEAANR